MRRRDDALNQERRKAILDAAANCFVRQGFHATSMKDVCVEAGMSPGTLYHYYSSKAEIVAGIIESESRFIGDLIGPRRFDAGFLAGLAAAISEIAERTSARDLALHAEIGAEVLRDPDLRRKAAEGDIAASTALAAEIGRSQQLGSLDPDIEPQAIAAALSMLIDGWLWQATFKGADWMRAQAAPLIQAAEALLGRTESRK